MADISKMNVNGTEYNIKDATARTDIETLKVKVTDISKQYEFERDVSMNKAYNTPLDWAVGFNQVYNGKKLDFSRVMLTGMIGHYHEDLYNPYYVNFIFHDITRQIQSIKSGEKLGFPLSGTFRPYVDYPQCEHYTFSCDVYREGDLYHINCRSLYIGSKTAASDDFTFFEGMVCRTICSDHIKQI